MVQPVWPDGNGEQMYSSSLLHAVIVLTFARCRLFIILALCGTVVALIALFVLPDYPLSTTGSAMWTMSEDMRKVAAARIMADRVSTEEGEAGVWQGLKMSVKDYKMWLLVGVNIGLSAAYGFSSKYSSIGLPSFNPRN